MKIFAAVLLLASAMLVAPVLAHSPHASPLLGRWAVEVSRLPMPPAARPRSVTIAFRATADGKWETQVDIVDAGGAKFHADSIAALDGSATPVTGGFEADTAALKQPAPNVLVLNLLKGGIQTSTRVYTVATDDRTMTEIASYVGGNGLPVLRSSYFKRIP